MFVQFEQPVGCRLGKIAEPLLAFTQGSFDLIPFRYVRADRTDPGNPVQIVYGKFDRQVCNLPIRGVETFFLLDRFAAFDHRTVMSGESIRNILGE